MSEVSIYQKQNEPDMLLLIKTQREIYSKAKKIFYTGISISIILTIGFSVLTFVCKNQYINVVSALASILTLIFGTVYTYKSDQLKETGAKIQQTFNYRLYNMKLNYGILNNLALNEITCHYASANFDNEINWYNDHSNLSKLKQIFHCQGEDFRWDKNLREKYLAFNITIVLIFITSILAFAFLSNLPVGQRFVYLIWIIPILQYLLNLLKDIFADFNTLNEIKNKQTFIAENLNILEENDLQQQLIDLQLYLFEHRKKAVLIPDWFYKRNKESMQEYENNLSKQNNSN